MNSSGYNSRTGAGSRMHYCEKELEKEAKTQRPELLAVIGGPGALAALRDRCCVFHRDCLRRRDRRRGKRRGRCSGLVTDTSLQPTPRIAASSSNGMFPVFSTAVRNNSSSFRAAASGPNAAVLPSLPSPLLSVFSAAAGTSPGEWKQLYCCEISIAKQRKRGQ